MPKQEVATVSAQSFFRLRGWTSFSVVCPSNSRSYKTHVESQKVDGFMYKYCSSHKYSNSVTRRLLHTHIIKYPRGVVHLSAITNTYPELNRVMYDSVREKGRSDSFAILYLSFVCLETEPSKALNDNSIINTTYRAMFGLDVNFPSNKLQP